MIGVKTAAAELLAADDETAARELLELLINELLELLLLDVSAELCDERLVETAELLRGDEDVADETEDD